MKKLLYILILITSYTFAQQLFLPQPSGGEIEHHTGYSLEYNEMKEQPIWVAFKLIKKGSFRKCKKKDAFRSDPFISTGSATLLDWKSSGDDRGHLSPAADFKWSMKVWNIIS